MRLLHTVHLTLQEFFDSEVPLYAILSHRWEGEEVSFRDLTERRRPGNQGYQKIQACCNQAMKDGFDWVVC